MFKKLSDSVLQVAGHRHAVWGLFGYAILESFLLPIPPDFLLMALVLARPAWAQRLALITVAGSVLGGLVGYAIGRFGFGMIAEPVLNWACQYSKDFCPDTALPKLQALFDKHGIWVIAISAISPIIPYRLMILVAGLAKMPIIPFIIMSIIFHWLRYGLVAFLVAKYGKKILDFIQGRLQLIFAVAGVVALVIYVAVRYF